MDNCIFCDVDISKYYNTIIEETNNFIVIPTIGSLVDGYILIVTKEHFYNMLNLDENIKLEYLSLINKYRLRFKNVYKKYPIVFEHGTNNLENTVSSIIHAHTHIVNHKFSDEKTIIEELKFKEFDFLNDNLQNNYIMYISNDNNYYISTSFNNRSQLMRYYIAKDLNMINKYDWNKYIFSENITTTIQKIKTID